MSTQNPPPSEVIEILDPTLRHGFAQIPRQVLRAPGLSRNAKCLYALLLDYAWQEGSCFPGQPRLAHDLGVSDRTIRTDLDELRVFGLIAWKRRGLSLTNVYQILSIADNPHLHDCTDREPERKHSSGLDRKESSILERKGISENKETGDKDSQHHQGDGAIGEDGNRNSPESERRNRDEALNTIAGVDQSEIPSSGGASPPGDAPLIAAIVEFGVSRGAAIRIVHRYPSPYIQSKLDQVHFLIKLRPSAIAKNPAGYLRCAIEDDYAPPPGYLSPEERLQKERAREDQRRMFDRMERQQRRRENRLLKAQNADKIGLDEQFPAIALSGTPYTTKTAWQTVQANLGSQLSSTVVQSFLEPCALIAIEGNMARVAAVSNFARDYLTRRLTAQVASALSLVLARQIRVEFVTVGTTSGRGTGNETGPAETNALRGADSSPVFPRT